MKPKPIQDAIIAPAALITALATCCLDQAICGLAMRAHFPRVIDGCDALAGLAAALSIPLSFATHLNYFDSVALTSSSSSSWTMSGAVLAMAGQFHLFRCRPGARSSAVTGAPKL
jgi:hypothetical protein